MEKKIFLISEDEAASQLLKQGLVSQGLSSIRIGHSRSDFNALWTESLEQPVVILCDVSSFESEVFLVLKQFFQKNPIIQWIALDQSPSLEKCLNILKHHNLLKMQGYFSQPWDEKAIFHQIEQCFINYGSESSQKRWMTYTQRYAQREAQKAQKYWSLILKSEGLRTVDQFLEHYRIQKKPSPSLLLGERGTEKMSLAYYMHCFHDPECQSPWLPIQLASYSEQALDHELYGVERIVNQTVSSDFFSDFKNQPREWEILQKKGVLELTQGGTIFLDGLDQLNFPVQKKLYEVLKFKRIKLIHSSAEVPLDLNVIASIENEQALIPEWKFYFQESILRIPSLRERPEDKMKLAVYFAIQEMRSIGKNFFGFSQEMQKKIIDYDWPGNVFELNYEIKKQCLVSDSQEKKFYFLKKDHIDSLSKNLMNYTENKKIWINAFEREYLVRLLMEHKGNVSSAARQAKIDRSNFLRLLRRHSLKASEYRVSDHFLEIKKPLQQAG